MKWCRTSTAQLGHGRWRWSMRPAHRCAARKHAQAHSRCSCENHTRARVVGTGASNGLAALPPEVRNDVAHKAWLPSQPRVTATSPRGRLSSASGSVRSRGRCASRASSRSSRATATRGSRRQPTGTRSWWHEALIKDLFLATARRRHSSRPARADTGLVKTWRVRRTTSPLFITKI